MLLYPAYDFEKVMGMYSVTFYVLLEKGYIKENAKFLMLAQISMLPSIENDARKRFLDYLTWAATDPSDILKQEDEGGGLEKLKEIFAGK